MHTHLNKNTESKTKDVANSLAWQAANTNAHFYLQDNRLQPMHDAGVDQGAPIQLAGPKAPRVDIKKASIKGAEEHRDKRRKDFAEDHKKKREIALSANRKYGPGSHGFKKTEQKSLSEEHGMDVTGSTHESEHTIGFEPLNQTSGLTRGKGSRARGLENMAPAYQEEKALHRDHIGTGSRGTADDSGFNAHSYRKTQRQLVEDGDVSSAVQINQLGYAFDPGFRTPSTASNVADDSYNMMVTNMNKVTYASGDDNMEVDVPAKQKAEMFLARKAAKSGSFPTVEEENEARKQFGLPEIDTDVDMK
jgi:hypothetical protein